MTNLERVFIEAHPNLHTFLHIYFSHTLGNKVLGKEAGTLLKKTPLMSM